MVLTPQLALATARPIHEFSLEDYHRMIECGILTENDKVELINGIILRMSPIGRFHATCVRKLTNFFVPRLLGKYSCSQEQPTTIANGSEPEPDYVIATYREDNYVSAHPTPEDIRLLIEVSDKTLAFDQDRKLALYAAAGIPEYWIVNLIDRQLEQYSQPDLERGSYASAVVVKEGETFDHWLTGKLALVELLP